MGVIDVLFGSLFGGGRNVVKETAEVFRVNAEAQATRDSDYSQAALQQFAAEFAHQRKGVFDRFVDAMNRVPRPAMALGVLGLMVSAMVDPIWFGERMQGIALVPEPMWWLLGAIVSFYFGARNQAKGQDFQRSIAATMAMAPGVVQNISSLRALNAGANPDAPNVASSNSDADLELEAIEPSQNPALAEWKAAENG